MRYTLPISQAQLSLPRLTVKNSSFLGLHCAKYKLYGNCRTTAIHTRAVMKDYSIEIKPAQHNGVRTNLVSCTRHCSTRASAGYLQESGRSDPHCTECLGVLGRCFFLGGVANTLQAPRFCPHHAHVLNVRVVLLGKSKTVGLGI